MGEFRETKAGRELQSEAPLTWWGRRRRQTAPCLLLLLLFSSGTQTPGADGEKGGRVVGQMSTMNRLTRTTPTLPSSIHSSLGRNLCIPYRQAAALSPSLPPPWVTPLCSFIPLPDELLDSVWPSTPLLAKDSLLFPYKCVKFIFSGFGFK